MKISFSLGSLQKMINEGFQMGEARPLLTGEERGVIMLLHHILNQMDQSHM